MIDGKPVHVYGDGPMTERDVEAIREVVHALERMTPEQRKAAQEATARDLAGGKCGARDPHVGVRCTMPAGHDGPNHGWFTGSGGFTWPSAESAPHHSTPALGVCPPGKPGGM